MAEAVEEAAGEDAVAVVEVGEEEEAGDAVAAVVASPSSNLAVQVKMKIFYRDFLEFFWAITSQNGKEQYGIWYHSIAVEIAESNDIKISAIFRF